MRCSCPLYCEYSGVAATSRRECSARDMYCRKWSVQGGRRAPIACDIAGLTIPPSAEKRAGENPRQIQEKGREARQEPRKEEDLKRYSKLWSIVLAIAMVLSIVVPSTSQVHADRELVENTRTVTLHKLLMSQTELDAWDSNEIEKGTEQVPGYNGTQNLTGLQEILNALGKGQTLKEIPDVYFAWQNAEGKFIDKYGLVVGDGTDPSEEHWVAYDNDTSAWKVVVEGAEGAEKVGVLGGLTTGSGIEFDVSSLPQPAGGVAYKIAEIPSLTTYKGDQQEDLAAHKAVPVEITLPLVNQDGIVADAHVYPKNTENKPSIDTNFRKTRKGMTPKSPALLLR